LRQLQGYGVFRSFTDLQEGQVTRHTFPDSVCEVNFEGTMQNTPESQPELTDERLLRDYAVSQDSGAFAAIVHRHGAMVFGVCRRILGREQDAEDAFQATFLVLLRKARSLTRPKRLANWLYGVAQRTASKIRAADRRQRQRESPMLPIPAPEAGDEMTLRELRSLLDDELERLPQRYRAPLVLFYLESKTVEEVASTLGCPRGTILAQLARGRERLRFRLIRRGLPLSAGVFATVLARAGSPERGVPEALLEWSKGVPSPQTMATGAPEGVSAQARLVAQRVLKDMSRRTPLLRAGLVLTGLLFLGGGLLGFCRSFPVPAVEPPDASAEMKKLQGTWQVVAVESDGKVIPAERVPFTRLTILGNTILGEGGIHDWKATFRLDVSREPKAIDLQDEGYHGGLYQAIYALDGDTLTICRSNGGARPTELASKPGAKAVLITARRGTGSRR
jgi:RNA polymerase sigma factor (sigma-70 family)